jgi:hypothetical protein
MPLSLRNHGGRNVNADQLRIRKYLTHSQEKVSWSGADVEYAPRSSVMGDVTGHQLVVPKEDVAAAQGAVKDTSRPGDPFGMKPLHELSPATAHIVQANDQLTGASLWRILDRRTIGCPHLHAFLLSKNAL